MSIKPESILEAGRSITDPLGRGLYFFLYLTGCRLSEARDFSKVRMEIFPDRRVIRLKTSKQRKNERMRKIPIPLGGSALCHEDEMWAEVTAFLEDYKEFDKPFSKWKNMSVYMKKRGVTQFTFDARVRLIDGSYKDTQIVKHIHAHFLRHARATHLVEYYRFNDTALCKFFGWRNPVMARIYTESADVWNAFKQATS
jgi:site-specific recombinase XerD